MSKKRTFFPIYQRILGAVFVLWFFLWLAGKFGLSFSLDPSILFKTFLFLFLIFLIWMTKKRWSLIYPFMKEAVRKIGNWISVRIRNTQEKIIYFAPILDNKMGTFIALVLSVIFSFSFIFWRIIRRCLMFLVSKRGFLLLTLFGIIVDIFVFNFVLSLIVLLFSTLLIVSIRLQRLKGEVVVAVGLVFLLLCAFLSAFETKPLAVEKIAIWAYVFLAIGSGQMFIENIRDIRN